MESTSSPTNRIGDRCGNERNKPRIELPFVSVYGRVSAFLSITTAQGWRKYGAVGLCGYSNSRQFPDVCLVKIAHYANGQGKGAPGITDNSEITAVDANQAVAPHTRFNE